MIKKQMWYKNYITIKKYKICESKYICIEKKIFFFRYCKSNMIIAKNVFYKANVLKQFGF